ncbi:MAG: SRPBCC family protein [Nitrospirota bacterium]
MARRSRIAMTAMSRTLSISINCHPDRVYDFVSNLENMPVWAATFCKSIKKSDGEWIAETPQGKVKIRLAEKNQFGILDHYISPVPGVEAYVPMRVMPNGSGSEMVFTLFRLSGMTEEQYAEDARLVEQDLRTLKDVLEK